MSAFRALGFRGMAVLTGLTVQDTRGVLAVRPLPSRFVISQFRALAADVRLAGVKVGMVGSKANLAAAARILDDAPGSPRVVDPVLRSSSGALLLESAAVSGYLRAVRGRLTVLTPNIPEAVRLSGLAIRSVEDMEAAARRLAERILAPCLIKGGHLADGPVNILFDGVRAHAFASPRLPFSVRGTGCYFSSVLLAALARGAGLVAACRQATRLTRNAMRRAERIGRGRLMIRGGR
jgi:hydroxymethylpyrimidine kinase/phosphomethylpyrimidine kinase